MKTIEEVTNKVISLEQGEVKVVSTGEEEFAVKYLGVRDDMHIFFRNSGECKVYGKPVWDMSPRNKHVLANEEGFIEVQELDKKLNNCSCYERCLARQVRSF